MIKALDSKNRLIVLGLSLKNIARLLEEKPIKFNLDELGLDDMDVVIMVGRTEQDIAASLGVQLPDDDANFNG